MFTRNIEIFEIDLTKKERSTAHSMPGYFFRSIAYILNNLIEYPNKPNLQKSLGLYEGIFQSYPATILFD